MEQQRTDERHPTERRSDAVHELWMKREEKTPDRGADDHRDLEDDRSERESSDEDLARYEGRSQSAGRRCAERRGDARPEREQEERPRRARPRPRHAEQAEHDPGLERERDREQYPARESVGQVPGGEREQRQRDEHREADEPEVEWVAPNGVHLPPDRDERHLDREPRGEHDAEEDDEVAVPERRVARLRARCGTGYAASPSSSSVAGVGRNSTSRRWMREPSTPSTAIRRPSVSTSSPGSAARPIRSKT